jgi:hypothetical protein
MWAKKRPHEWLGGALGVLGLAPSTHISQIKRKMLKGYCFSGAFKTMTVITKICCMMQLASFKNKIFSSVGDPFTALPDFGREKATYYVYYLKSSGEPNNVLLNLIDCERARNRQFEEKTGDLTFGESQTFFAYIPLTPFG